MVTCFYICAVLQALYVIDDLLVYDEYEKNMVHRNVVILNLNKYMRLPAILFDDSTLVTQCLKLIMLLTEDKHTYHRFILERRTTRTVIIHKSYQKRTHVFLKLNVRVSKDISDRLIIRYSATPYRSLLSGIISQSNLSYLELKHKSILQHTVNNNISCEALLSLSSTAISINRLGWVAALEDNKNYLMHAFNAPKSSSIYDLFDNISLEKSIVKQEIETIALAKNKHVAYSIRECSVFDEFIIYDNLSSASQYKEAHNYLLLRLDFLRKCSQKLYYYLVAEKLLSIEDKFYIPYFMDFRGRIYPNSVAAPLYLKSFRPLFYLKHPADNKLSSCQTSSYYNRLLGASLSLPEIFIKHIKTDSDNYLVRLCLKELGKLIKPDLDYKSTLSLQNFIDLGYKAYHLKPESFKIEDRSYASNIIKCLSK